MKQKPFTAAQKKALLANFATAERTGDGSDAKPAVKFFCPWGAATWLISEWDGEDRMFGLCDLGHGSPELGYVSLSELQSIRGRFGLTIERDLHFTADKTMAQYADEARAADRIVA